MNELFLQIVSAILTIIIALSTYYLKKWINTKVSKEQMDMFNYYLDLAVRCANQIYTPEEWEDKKEFVMHYLTDVVNDKLNLSLNEADLSNLIEGKVNEVKQGLK